jgi:hypothetical protein
MTRIAAIAALALLLAACSIHGGPERYTGLYADSFEMQAFTADGAKETWWATLEPEARAAINAAKGPEPRPPFGFRIRAEIEGTLSAPGHYGHMGAYPRQITITRILKAKRESSAR